MGKTIQIISKQVGEIFFLQGAVVFSPVIVALIYREWYSAGGFLISALFISGIGRGLYYLFKKADDPEFDQALIVAAAGWLGIAVLGAIPLYIIALFTPDIVIEGYIPDDADYSVSSLMNFRNPLHAFFESMSGYTVTGLTMSVHEPSVGKSILFYRSVMQWVGGAGFVLMVIATFDEGSNRSRTMMFISESSGEKLRRHVIDSAKIIWKLYIFLTLFIAIYLFIGTLIILPDYPIGENVFNSVNHALTGMSTGGFSTLDNSIADYGSLDMEILHILPMIVGSLSIPFYYRMFYEKKYGLIWKDAQTRTLLICLVIGSLILSLLLFRANRADYPFHRGIFQFVSGMTTTGWQTADIVKWDYISILFIVAGMFVGGAAGATTGGIKIVRALHIMKELRWQINKTFFRGQTIQELEEEGGGEKPGEKRGAFVRAATLAIMFFMIIYLSSILTHLFTGHEYDYSSALFEAASAQGTVGLTTGITNPSMPAGLEIIYIFQMWTGRLEIIPVLALIRVLIFGRAPRIIKW